MIEALHLCQTFLLLLVGLAQALSHPFENARGLEWGTVQNEDFNQIGSSNEGKLDQTSKTEVLQTPSAIEVNLGKNNFIY